MKRTSEHALRALHFRSYAHAIYHIVRKSYASGCRQRAADDILLAVVEITNKRGMGA